MKVGVEVSLKSGSRPEESKIVELDVLGALLTYAVTLLGAIYSLGLQNTIKLYGQFF